MSLTVEVDVDEHEILDYLEDAPDLVAKALRRLAEKAKENGKDHLVVAYQSAHDLMGGKAAEAAGNPHMATFISWAEIFTRFDSIDRLAGCIHV